MKPAKPRKPKDHNLTPILLKLAQKTKKASKILSRTPAEQRTLAIMAMRDLLLTPLNQKRLLAANQQDLKQATAYPAALRDRLTLTPLRLEQMAKALTEIAREEDPVGLKRDFTTRPNGLRVQKMRLPLGVILMIYEARPNVTIDTAALCLRSGNAAILRGGKEAHHTNQALLKFVVKPALLQAQLPSDSLNFVPTLAHEAIDILVTCNSEINLVIPRGGPALIKRVTTHSRIPVVSHYQGICHIFVERTADFEMTKNIVANAKVSRPGVCNALETLLLDSGLLTRPELLQDLFRHLASLGVELRVCRATYAFCKKHLKELKVKLATPKDWDTEYLDLILAVRLVKDLQAAITHIDLHGSEHTASIITNDQAAAATFLEQVNASCVLVNASTRFNDGGELGLGAEIGISTSRVHAFGPMGALSLTTEKFIVHGQGQIRT